MATFLVDIILLGHGFETTKVDEASSRGATSPLYERDTDSGAYFVLLIFFLAREKIG